MKKELSDPRESLWRRKISAAERGELRAQPELALEARLTEALAKIPDAAVPSNFTARLLDAIELKAATSARPRWHWHWRSLLPRVAAAAAVLLFAGILFQNQEIRSRRAALAQSVALVAGAQALPSVEALDNFDAIRLMSQPVHADGELLADLQ